MNEDFITTEEAQPTRDNRNIIIIVVIAVVLLCCCCSVILYTGYNYWGDPLLELLGY
jgi:hypothetical protein